MAVEDIEWRERYGDQSYKSRSLIAIRAAFLALTFSQTVILPSLPAFLSVLHSHPSMVGYCLCAQCLGELCTTHIFSRWYDRRSAREVVTVALMINAAGNLLYAAAPHRMAVLASRFIVGSAFGVREVLMTLIGGFTHQGNRAQVLSSMRSMHIVALVLGLGLAAVATFWHMPAPQPLGRLHYKIPSYVKRLENNSVGLVNESIALGHANPLWANFLFDGLDRSLEFSGRRDFHEDLQDLEGIDEGVQDSMGGFVEDAVLNDVLNGNENITSPSQQPREIFSGTAVETDQDIGEQIGDSGLYIPGYLTALVGHGLKAPGYLGCFVSLAASIFTWRILEEGPRKILTQRVPLVHLSPRSLSYFLPLVSEFYLQTVLTEISTFLHVQAACLALEGLAQICYVAFEVMVAQIIRLRGNWLVDATAVSMLFITAFGVVGLAVVEQLKKQYPLRHIMLGCVCLVLIGNIYSLPWSLRPSIFQYILGCSLSSAGFFPLSAIASQVRSLLGFIH
uniref:Major facilitator superfamily (MFS) profile domain-containing protein n=1 Tax=Cryptomonas curvata TaxID=233186 RepID=A0A7S0MJY6_9CRYP|mmetsp:Transcript_45076/g.94391  ORF Transcript_45076/g.94391 Transcript_45076/m.94391 type:complete len:507 (+) Transcript_45076:84-1604(+)